MFDHILYVVVGSVVAWLVRRVLWRMTRET